MIRRLRAALVAVWLGGCALSHGATDDGGPTAPPDGGPVVLTDGGTVIDGAVTAGDASTGGGGPIGSPDGLACGPNRCRTTEVCCDDRCGICAFEGECPSFDCPDPAGP